MSDNLHRTGRETTAFFATRAAADRAASDLKSEGFGADRVSVAPGAGSGFVVRVKVEDKDLERVSDILSKDETVKMDEAQSGGAGSSGVGSQQIRGALESGAGRAVQGARDVLGGARQGVERIREESGQAVEAYDGFVTRVRENALASLTIAFAVGYLVGRSRG